MQTWMNGKKWQVLTIVLAWGIALSVGAIANRRTEWANNSRSEL